MAKQLPIAALAFDLSPEGTGVQIFPAGEFSVPRGALRGEGPWRMNAAAAARLLANIHALSNPVLVDYEHHSLFTDQGVKAVAAGWLARDGFEWRDGEGFFHRAPEWTAAASAAIKAREYRYTSAIFSFDPETGHPVDLINLTLTNSPAIDGMQPLAAASARLVSMTLPETLMPLPESVAELLGVAPDVDAAAVDAAVAALGGKLAEAEGLRSQVAALSAKTPDPAQFAPAALVQDLQQEIATLRAQGERKEADSLITAALAAGKIASPPKRAYANSLAGLDDQGQPLAGTRPNLAALRAYLDSEDANPALVRNQTGGRAAPQDSNLPLPDAAEQEWKNSAALRAEFADVGHYVAFCRANAAGLVKINHGGAE
jgi:phage I-like protein